MTLPWNPNNFPLPNPLLTNPFQPSTVGNQLIKVKDLDSAKAYPTSPNSSVALFEENDDVMYIKTTDANNFPTIRKFRFTEEPIEVPNSSQYVTIDEFNKFKEEILNAKQSLWEQATSRSSDDHTPTNSKYTTNGEQYSTNKKFDGNGKKQ